MKNTNTTSLDACNSDGKTATCMNCSVIFQYKRKSSKFCSRTCKDDAQQRSRKQATERRKKQKLANKEYKFDNSPFSRYLVDQARRAGTVQIFERCTASDLLELLNIRKRCTTYSGFKSGKTLTTFHISHLTPVVRQGEGLLRPGLLHPSNLVICTAEYNQKRKNKESKTERATGTLNKKYIVGGNEQFRSVLKKIKLLLGRAVLKEFLTSANIQLSRHATNIEKMIKLGYPYEDLENASAEAIESLLASNGKRAVKSVPDRPPYPGIYVMMEELKRTGNEDSFLYTVLEHLNHHGHPVGYADPLECSMALVTCPLQPYQSTGERSKGLQVN